MVKKDEYEEQSWTTYPDEAYDSAKELKKKGFKVKIKHVKGRTLFGSPYYYYSVQGKFEKKKLKKFM